VRSPDAGPFIVLWLCAAFGGFCLGQGSALGIVVGAFLLLLAGFLAVGGIAELEEAKKKQR
jgi:hypothetical protein